jgi:hypothetical protein
MTSPRARLISFRAPGDATPALRAVPRPLRMHKHSPVGVGCGFIVALSPQCKTTIEWIRILSSRTEENEIKIF